MSRCDDVRASAAGLAALRRGDPERDAAFEHARACPGCAEALAESERVLALLRREPPFPSPSAEALRRASAPILADLQRRTAPIAPLLLAAAVLASYGLWLAIIRERLPEERLWTESVVVAVLAAGGTVASIFVGGWIPFALVAASGGFAALAGSGGDLFAALGIACAAVELGTSVLPLAAAIALAKTGRLSASPALYAGIMGAGALAGQAMLHVHCAAQSQLPHLLVFHVGGVVAAAALGAMIGRIPFFRAASAT
jgi:hypothetical protein